MDFFPVLTAKSKLCTPEELFLMLLNNSIGLALEGTQWTGYPGTECGRSGVIAKAQCRFCRFPFW